MGRVQNGSVPKIPGAVEGTRKVMSDVELQIADGVALITLNQPDRLNALSDAMNDSLVAAFVEAIGSAEVRAIVLTGAGRAFCAGADLRDGAGSVGVFAGTFWEKPTTNSFESGWEIFKPVIAAVNGYCLGYGLTLVTWCDFVIASERAEFGFPEVNLGTPAAVAALRLPERIGWQYAMELLLTGDRIDAWRAKEIGLAGWVVPHEDLMEEAGNLARRLTAGAPLAQRAMKEIAMRTRRMPTVEAIRFAETMRKVAAATEDAAEGGRAVAEGRPPRWQGR
jgi:enoyl-CoA hydratase/carnithine racemase